MPEDKDTKTPNNGRPIPNAHAGGTVEHDDAGGEWEEDEDLTPEKAGKLLRGEDADEDDEPETPPEPARKPGKQPDPKDTGKKPDETPPKADEPPTADDEPTDEEKAIAELLGLDVEKDSETPPKPDKPDKRAKIPPELQAEVDRIVKARLAKDREVNSRAVDEALVAHTGKTLQEITQDNIAQRAEALQVERGLDPDTARQVAELEAKDRQREQEHKNQKAAAERERNVAAYQAAKTKGATNPFARLYASDIDAFSEEGASLSYEDSVRYVLGDKLLSGDLLGTIKKAVERSVVKKVAADQAKPPVRGGGGAKPATDLPQLTAAQKRVADNMGVSHERYAKRLKELESRRGRRKAH